MLRKMIDRSCTGVLSERKRNIFSRNHEQERRDVDREDEGAQLRVLLGGRLCSVHGARARETVERLERESLATIARRRRMGVAVDWQLAVRAHAAVGE